MCPVETPAHFLGAEQPVLPSTQPQLAAGLRKECSPQTDWAGWEQESPSVPKEGFYMAHGRTVASWAPELSQKCSPRACTRGSTGPALAVPHSQRDTPGINIPVIWLKLQCPACCFSPLCSCLLCHDATFAFLGLSSSFLCSPCIHPNPSTFLPDGSHYHGVSSSEIQVHTLADGRGALGMRDDFCE